MPSLQLYFLSTPRLERGGMTLAMDTRKAVAMLAYLALTGERQTRDSLAALLWPEMDHRRGKAALRRTLSTLKTAVGEGALHITREAIGLRPGSYWCDVTQFQQHVNRREWAEAVALYRDQFMTGFTLRDSIPFDDWQLAQAESCRREWTNALAALCQEQHAAGDTGTAIITGHRWLQADPLREEAHRQLMQLYVQAGQRNKALTQFRDCVRILDEELGVTPLPETVALYEAIRENKIAGSQLSSSNRSEQDDHSAPPAALFPDPLRGSPLLPLVGRTHELAQMLQVYAGIEEDGRLLVIEGEVGIGKTRLAEDFISGGPEEGAVVLSARCYEGETNLAYAPMIQLLRNGLQEPEAAVRLGNVPDHFLAAGSWLLPELAGWQTKPQSPVDQEAPGAQNRFYEGVGHILASLLQGARPGVLWLDDAHWLDSASLELLLFLLRRWRGRPYLILLCWRNDTMPASHPLTRLVAELRREGVGDQHVLSRFTPAEVLELLGAVLPTPAPELMNRVYRETEGLPFFIAEYLSALLQQQLPFTAEGSWDIPRTVRDLLVTRLAQVDETEHQLLQTAATIGHASDYDLLWLISGRSDEETIAALEKLVTRGLLVEQTAGYDFSHTKLRELAYEEMGLARRRLLHRRVAEALSKPRRRQVQTMAVTADIANHYQKAGLDEEAAAYFVQAGDQARSLYAHQEALHYFQSALALGYGDAWKLHEAGGDMHTRLGDYAGALTSYETAASLADPAELGRLEHKLAQVYIRQGAWRQAEAQLRQAQAQLRQPAARARLYLDWSYVAFNLRAFAQANAHAQRGQQLAETPQLQAQCHNISGLLARHEGSADEARTHFAQSVALAQTHGLPDTEIAALNNLALVETAAGQVGAAQEHLQTALSLCAKYGDRHREAALHNNLADLYHQLGDEEASMAALKTAVAIYAEIGGQPGNWQPEIWKLTAW